MKTGALCFSGTNLSCIRDDRVLFEQLNFTLQQGQALLLEGKNGSGKTSLLRILCGFRLPDSGSLSWCGADINGSEFYEHMAYVGHLDGFKKELTVLENLKVVKALNQPGRFSIEQSLEKLQLAGYDDVLVQALSAGQQRRLSIVRLLMTASALWILDEPFTSLDRQGIALTETLMTEHCANGGMIILTSHHDLNLSGVDLQRINLS